MALFHRLVPPSYLGGVPATHDEINNASSGTPAMVDVAKAAGPNAGSYFIAFGEDGTSLNGNRAHAALARNTDYLDDIVNGEVPVVAHNDFASVGDVSKALTGDVFVGKPGTANNQDERDRLIKLVDVSTGNDVLNATGSTIKASLIHNGASANQVGVPASGFFTAPTVNFSSAVPSGINYRIIFGRRSSLRDAILDKTRLDAFTRQVIRGAHQVPGESLRFIREAGRRTAGQLQALVATVVETPGLGENLLAKANAMSMDVDPDGTQGDNGTWGVRFNRDTTPKILLRVDESTAGNSAWESVAERVAFKDLNTAAAGFAEDRIPLTSSTAADGDDMVRVFENDPGVPFSILKRLNAAPFVTCGDGVSTFGDFNGVTALVDAVAFALASGVTSYRIFLKAGQYEVDNLDLTTSDNNHVLVEGVSRGAIIQCTNATNPTSAGLTASGRFNQIVLRNLLFQGSGELAFYALTNYLLIEDCAAIDKGVRVDVDAVMSPSAGPARHVLIMRRSTFGFSGTASTPVLHYAFRVGTPEAYGFLVEDCVLNSPLAVIGYPTLRVESVNINAPGKISGVFFKRCYLRLGTSNDDGGGDMQGNSGVVELVPGTTSGHMELGSFEWEDCYVSISGAQEHRPLFYWRPDDGAGAFNSIGNESIVRIRGGRWVASVGSATTPFYLGGETYTAGAGAAEVSIEDIWWGYDAEVSTNGEPTTEVAGPAAVDWASFFICALVVHMRNVNWILPSGLSTSGDLYIAAARVLDIDGVTLGAQNWSNGLGAAPSYRVRVECDTFQQFQNPRIDNLLIGAPDTAQAALGMLVVRPNGGLVVSNANISGNIAAAGSGIYVAGGASVEAHGLHLVDCRIERCALAGFIYDASSGAATPLTGLKITRCRLTDNGYGAVFSFGVANKLHDVTIADCELKDSVGRGLDLGGTAPWDNDAPGLIMHGNVFADNNTIGDGSQAALSASSNAVGSFYGNSATAGGGSPAGIVFTAGPSVDFRGSETGYTYDPAAGSVAFTPNNAAVTTALVADSRRHVTGEQMVHNRMRYL